MASESENLVVQVERVSEVLRTTLRQVAGAADQNLLVFHDLGAMSGRIRALQEAFPEQSLHAVAIKANPIVGVLESVVAAGGGLEAASFEEAMLAVRSGCPAERVVFDSPAKTRAEIAESLRRGFYLNADSFDELERISEIRRDVNSHAKVGLRVNPQVGAGKIAITSVATNVSKFGVPIGEHDARIVEAFRTQEWLAGLHVHVGSQGCSLIQLADAAVAVVDLLERIEYATRPGRVLTVDIGGGLPFPYTARDEEIPLVEYVGTLRRRASRLFRPDIRLITEFGRWLQAGCGWVAARVEYTKRVGGQNIAICHAGADLLMRPVYQPGTWQHRYSVLAADGRVLEGSDERAPWTVAGPLCFAGDIVLRDVVLPTINIGDWLIFHDAGAYTLSMWSRHCSRSVPMVIGYDGQDPASPHVLLERESPDDIADFWSRGWKRTR